MLTIDEDLIFSHLIGNEPFARKVFPFLKTEYFTSRNNKIIFELISNHISAYHVIPTKEVVTSSLTSLDNISMDDLTAGVATVESWNPDLNTSLDWLTQETEKFCQERAVYNAVMESIKIIESKDTKQGKGAIPEILQEALGVSFDANIGHDFFADAESRYDFYNKVEEKIEFDLELFNTITKGGLAKNTLSCILASTGVGKTMFMTHCASYHLSLGKNVLYITMEMAEERISERIDANLMNITVDELHTLPKDSFLRKINGLKAKTRGKLVVKEYPTSQAGAAHFRHLLQELRIKKNFKPDIIYIDYLNICASSRMKMGGSVNSYMYIKSIAEELRGLAVEFNVPIVTATQSNRDGYENSDIGLDNTSESFGLPATVDLMFALIGTEELEALNQIMVKQLKNRGADINQWKRFCIGVDRAKMRFYDCEQSAQDDIIENKRGRSTAGSDRPVMDNSPFGERHNEDSKMQSMTKTAGRKDFSGLRLT